jgi:V/A-type H+-transporting ATPase subunit E
MAEKEIKIAIKETFEQEKEKLLNQAQKEADDILSEARREAQLIKNSYIKELEGKMQQEKQRALNESSLQAKREILIEKEKVFNEIVDAVTARLKDIRKDGHEYYNILKSLIIEAEESLPDVTVKIRISTEDIPLCEKIFADLNFTAEIETGLTSAGGLIMSDLEERYICDNTFEARLNRILPQLRQQFLPLVK